MDHIEERRQSLMKQHHTGIVLMPSDFHEAGRMGETIMYTAELPLLVPCIVTVEWPTTMSLPALTLIVNEA